MQKTIRLLLFLVIMSGMNLASYAQKSDKKVRYNYLTYLPTDYDSLKAYPVIFYLHGLSVSGTNIDRIRRYGLPFFLDRGKRLDFIVIAPQCPRGQNWTTENWLDTIYNEVSAKHRIDRYRVYLTGMSLGGFGTWELANRHPYKFAAIAPVCGGGKVEWAENLSHIPAWVFHGDKDKQVSVSRSDVMVKALEKSGSEEVVYSRFPNKGHNIHRVYDDDNLYEWFLKFVIRDPNEEKLQTTNTIQLAELQIPDNQRTVESLLLTPSLFNLNSIDAVKLPSRKGKVSLRLKK